MKSSILRGTLRALFLSALALCFTQQMMAKDYVVQSSEKSFGLGGCKTEELPNVPLLKFSVDMKKQGGSMGNFDIKYDGTKIVTVKSGDLSTSYKKFSYDLPEGAIGKKIEFAYVFGFTLSRQFKNLIVTQARYLRWADKTTAEKSMDWGLLEQGATAEAKTFNVDYSDVLVNATIEGEGAAQYAISETSFGDNDGAYEPNKQLSVSYNTDVLGKHDATLVLTAANGNVLRIQLSAETCKEVGRVTCTDGGYFSFAASETYQLPEGVTAYTGVLNGTNIELTELTARSVIEGGKGLVFKGTVGETYVFYSRDAEAVSQANEFEGASNEITPAHETYDYYVLGYAVNKPKGFYKYTAAKDIPANKAFIRTVKSSGAPSYLSLGDEETGIQTLKESARSEEVYNLSGQRIQRMQRGINIVGGKKVLK